MQRPGKAVIVAGSLLVFALAGVVLVYSGFRPGARANASPPPELLSEVPAGAPTLVYADLAAIRASAFYQRRPDRGPITLPDRDYADFVQSTGFDFEKDLDRVVLASWPSGMGSPEKQTVVIADGRFDRRKIQDYALRKGKLDHQQGREVFQFSSDDNGQKRWNSLTFLTDHRIAIVEGASIAPLLAHHETSAEGDPARDRAARVAGAAVFAVTRVPAIPDNNSAGGSQSTQLAKMAQSIQWITLAARPEGNDLRVSLEGECRTPADARQLQSTLEVFRMIGSAGLESARTHKSMPPATVNVLEAMLKDADISATAERVRVLVEVTPGIMKLGEARKTQ
jgi:hypothetical protein